MTKIVFPGIQKKAREIQRRMVERFNRTVLHSEFPDGSKVMSLDPIKGDKLAPRYEGPYTVVRKTTGGSYVVKDGTGAELGRNFAPSQLKLVLEDFDPTETYEVETILKHREQPGEGVEYLVSWKGYGVKDQTWEPQESFIERKCIDDYWKTQELPGARSSRITRQNMKRLEPSNDEQELPSKRQKNNSRNNLVQLNDNSNEVTKVIEKEAIAGRKGRGRPKGSAKKKSRVAQISQRNETDGGGGQGSNSGTARALTSSQS